MADAFRGDGGRALARSTALLRTPVIGHRDGESERRYDRVPERHLGVPGKGVHDAHAQARAGPRAFRPRELRKQLALECDCVGRAPPAPCRGAAARFDDAVRAIAAVAAHELAPTAEVDHREQAAVPAAPATPAAASREEAVELLAAGKAAAHGARTLTGGGVRSLPRGERRADGAHKVRRVKTHHLLSAHELEGPQHGIGHERASLHHHAVAEGVEPIEADDAEQRIAHDGARDAGGDVLHGNTAFLGVADTRAHEYGAFGSQVNGRFRQERLFGELLGGRAQRMRRPLYERAASAGTGLVQHGVEHPSVSYPDSLHVLAAYIEQEREIGAEAPCSAHMGERLHHPGVEAQPRPDQILPVPAGRGVGHVGVGRPVDGTRHDGMEVPEHGDSRLKHLTAGRAAVGVGEAPRLVEHRQLDGRRSGVQPEVERAFAVEQPCARHRAGGVAPPKGGKFSFGREQAGQPGEVVREGGQAGKPLLEGDQRHIRVTTLAEGLRTVQRRATRGEQVGVEGLDAFSRREAQGGAEPPHELGDVLQGPAEEDDGALDGATARKPSERLAYHGLQGARRNVRRTRSRVEQGADIRLGEHGATRRDGVHAVRAERELAKLRRLQAEHKRYRVDEASGPARAGSVHTLLETPGEVHQLRILAAQLHDGICLGALSPNRRRRGNHLLHERQPEQAGNPYAGGAGDAHGALYVAEAPGQLVQRSCKRRRDVRTVPPVHRMDHGALPVQDDDLDRLRPYVYADARHVKPSRPLCRLPARRLPQTARRRKPGAGRTRRRSRWQPR